MKNVRADLAFCDNAIAVQPNSEGSAAERLAFQIRLIDPHVYLPPDRNELEALLDRLQTQMVWVPKGEELRAQQYNELYNSKLRDLEKAKRYGLYPKTFRLLPPSTKVTPDVLREFQDIINELDERIEKYESQTPDQRRVTALEASRDALTARLKLITDHSNKLVDAIKELEERLIRLEAVTRLGPRLVGPAALTAVEGSPTPKGEGLLDGDGLGAA
jgi:hypothetical protein